MPKQPAMPDPPRYAPHGSSSLRQVMSSGSGGPTGPAPQSPGIGWLILPLRIFFGITFLYAGVDKLLDPTFLDPNAPGSIVAQMHGFMLHSPLAPLISAIGLPLAIPLGFLIAVGEIAVGVGALTGIAFRLAAAGGFAISIMFWLTASWTASPYFYGPDLPYAFGWLTLALIGDRGVLSLASRLQRAWVAINSPVGYPERKRDPRRPGLPPALVVRGAQPMSPGRRALLQVSVLAAAAIALGGVTRFIAPGSSGLTADGPGTTPTDGPTEPPPTEPPPTDSTTLAPGATATPFRPTTAPATPSGPVVATLAAVQQRTAVAFTDPNSGDPAVVIALKNGSFAAFDTVCTHAGCTVSYIKRYDALLCPCHGAAFDPNNHAAVLQGPTSQPLRELPIKVDQATGQIYLKG